MGGCQKKFFAEAFSCELSSKKCFLRLLYEFHSSRSRTKDKKMEILQGVNKSLQSYLVNQPNKNALQECDNTTRSLVQYFIAFYLRSKLDHALLAGLPRDYLIPPQNPTDLQNLIAKLCFEMEDNNGHFFDALPAKLAITDGMNWGRIISLFTFSGVLSRFFIEKKKPILVVETAALLTDFINEHVMIWINANGGWDGLSKKMAKNSKLWTNALVIGGIWATTYLLISGR